MTTHEFIALLHLMGFEKLHDKITAKYAKMSKNGLFCWVTIALMIRVEWTPVHPRKDRVNFSYVNPASAFEDIREGLTEVQDGRVG